MVREKIVGCTVCKGWHNPKNTEPKRVSVGTGVKGKDELTFICPTCKEKVTSTVYETVWG